MTVRSSRSRRRRRWTAAINAMNGALVIAAVVAVIEIGSPVANNLGLSVGPPSTAGTVAGSQILQNAAVPSWEQAAASVAHAASPGSVVALPRTAEALASSVTSGTGPYVLTSAPVADPTVAASPASAPTAAPAASVAVAVVASPVPATASAPAQGAGGAAAAVPHPGGNGPSAGSGPHPGNGQPGRNAGGTPGPFAGAAVGGDRPGFGGPPSHGPGPGRGGPGDGGDHDGLPGPSGNAGDRPPCDH